MEWQVFVVAQHNNMVRGDEKKHTTMVQQEIAGTNAQEPGT